MAPSGAVARVRANLAAIRTLRDLQESGRAADLSEQAVLARWSGWGAVPTVFDEDNEEFAWARTDLRDLLTENDYRAASRNVLNAHYTDAGLVREIWRAVERLGFEAGRVLEPGCGAGTFLGMAPEGAEMFGVELDPTTAAIASHLYPHAMVRSESFADTTVRDGSFDLVVGNVPFGKFALHDPRHNRAGHSIHNHFILKSLHLTRPGGLVVLLTSRYTLDGQNPAARREIASLADLVAAVRLPSAAHRRAAGTDVVTDLLLLRRRLPGAEPLTDPARWERTGDFAGNSEVRVNTYFDTFPDMVLGRMVLRADGGRYGRADLDVASDQPAPEALADALDRIAARAQERGLTLAPRPDHEPSRSTATTETATSTIARQEGLIEATADGFTQILDGEPVAYAPPSTQADELRALLELRDTAVELLEAEAASTADTGPISGLRARLNRDYDAYVAAWGLLNRFTWRRTGRVDPDTGVQRQARARPGQGGFRDDPYAPVVFALENVDETGTSATKATIFTRRVVAPRTPRLGADTPADALAICLDVHGQVRLDVVAGLLGIDPGHARAALGTLVFDDPESEDDPPQLVPAAEYLSGQVRDKLAAARAAAESDPQTYRANIDALIEVVPPDLKPGDIEARLGASWIAPAYVQDFARELLDDDKITVKQVIGAEWKVENADHLTVLATSTWGTGRYPAPRLLKALLEQRFIRVSDEKVYYNTEGEPRTRKIPNQLETVAAQEKADAIGERFAAWLWENDERAIACAARYNELFNNLLLRSYDDIDLSLPGLAEGFTPRPHQIAAVGRIISEPAVLLAHEVGAGKTAEMCMGAMELRRLGLARKPAIVVPNHMLEQFSREFLQIYPRANILAAGMDDLTGDRRRRLIARVATGDWDAVILTAARSSGCRSAPTPAPTTSTPTPNACASTCRP